MHLFYTLTLKIVCAHEKEEDSNIKVIQLYECIKKLFDLLQITFFSPTVKLQKVEFQGIKIRLKT